MNDAQSLDFEWAGIAFQLRPQPRADVRSGHAVVLQWRRPTGECGSRRHPGVAEAMQHSRHLVQVVSGGQPTAS